jgi:cell division protein FtsN
VQTVAWTQSQPQPLSATAAAALNSYVVQVGAFSDPATAHRIEAAVQSAGSVSVDSRATASGATLYRVRLGPYSSREEADAARRAVANLGFAEAIVAH